MVFAASSLESFSGVPDDFKDIQVTLPANMKGWSGERPTSGSTVVYHLKGISFMSNNAGQIASNYLWNFSSPPKLSEALSDPFKLIQYELYLTKEGRHADVMKLVDPSTSLETLATLNRPDVVKETHDNFSDRTGGGMLLAYEDKGTILIIYYLQSGTKRLPGEDRVRLVNNSYVLVPDNPSANDNRPTNFFTAFYDTFAGFSNDIEVTP